MRLISCPKQNLSGVVHTRYWTCLVHIAIVVQEAPPNGDGWVAEDGQRSQDSPVEFTTTKLFLCKKQRTIGKSTLILIDSSQLAMATRWGICSAGKISQDFSVALRTLVPEDHEVNFDEVYFSICTYLRKRRCNLGTFLMCSLRVSYITKQRPL